MIDETLVHSELGSRPDIAINYGLDGGTLQRLESCQGVWIFDKAYRRFCRVRPDGRPPPVAEWSAYYHLEVDIARGCFSIALNEHGTSVLRSWFHVAPCRFCGTPVPQSGRSSRAPGDAVQPITRQPERTYAAAEEAL